MGKHKTFKDEYPKGVVLNSEVVDLLESFSKQKKSTAFDDLTFEKLTLADKPSNVHPSEVSLKTFITRNIMLKNCGILSAAMDTVTEERMALAMAQMGGIGILHRNLDPEEQAKMLEWVRLKIHYGGMIENPVTFGPDVRFSVVQDTIEENDWTFTSFPIVDEKGKLLGLLTRDETDFIEEKNPVLSEIMKPRNEVVTAKEGTNNEEAYQIMKEKQVKKLPIITKNDRLVGMFVWNDVKNDHRKRDLFSLDDEGHYLVGAAIGMGEEDVARVDLLVKKGCKVLVLDSSHGACDAAVKQITRIRKKHGDKVDIIAGNIASYDSAKYLLEAEHKPDALKVGIGPGSICTTRQVTGTGISQITATFEVWKAVKEHGDKTGYYVPIITDGGLRHAGDIVKCLAVGANAVMLGSVLAGTHESPGNLVVRDGKQFKTIRGMGSRAAMSQRSGSRGRYHRQDDTHVVENLTKEQKQKLVPEGVEGVVELRGSVEEVITELIGGVCAGLGHTGAKDIPSFQKKATLWLQTDAGAKESKPHDIEDIRD